MTSILIVYASADGSTAEVAERLGDQLRQSGAQVTVASVGAWPDPSLFDVVVAGSAIHDGALLPEFVSYVQAREAVLTGRPVWLFSLGMGPILHGPIGTLMARTVPPAIAAVRDQLGAVDYHQFAGRFTRSPQRRIRMVMWAIGAAPGDHRDWDDVQRWAVAIAQDPSGPAG